MLATLFHWWFVYDLSPCTYIIIHGLCIYIYTYRDTHTHMYFKQNICRHAEYARRVGARRGGKLEQVAQRRGKEADIFPAGPLPFEDGKGVICYSGYQTVL